MVQKEEIMRSERVTDHVWWTRYGEHDSPSLVVTSEATETEVAFCKAVEAFGIWEVVWESEYATKVRKGERV